MKFFPASRALYTDAGELVKVLACPLRMAWDELAPQSASRHRVCAECDHAVLNTSGMGDAEVLAIVRADRSTCLCVSSQQDNVAVLPGVGPSQPRRALPNKT